MIGPDPVSGPHTHAHKSVARTMAYVIAALAPAALFGLYLFGWPAVNTLLLTVLSAWLSELLCLRLAGKPLRPFLFDGSAILTGLLLAMSLPPWAPWWLGVFGGVFAIVIGKHVFGGLGQNVFNPAMLARVALLISFPLEMTTWVAPTPLLSATAPDFMASLAISFQGIDDIDAVSSASVLGHLRTALTQGIPVPAALQDTYTAPNAALGLIGGSLGETSALLLLLGGLLLLGLRVISWPIPLAMLVTLFALASGFHVLNPERYADGLVHLLAGGTLLAAFFIVTDPVTSPSTRRGQILFGAGTGALIYVIRTWGGYPEGVSFAVLIMNALTPLIDYYVRPRVYGRTTRGEPIEYSADKIQRRTGEGNLP